MTYLLVVSLFISSVASASIMGISTHPLKQNSQAFSAEMLGHMGQQREMGMGLRYTRDLDYFKRLDLAVAAAEKSQNYQIGTGLETELVSEDLDRPRVGVKGFYYYQKEQLANFSLIGLAPSLSKGFALKGYEVFPYLALPMGMKVDNGSDEFKYSLAMSAGLSMPFPGEFARNVLVNFELNRDLAASSDYIGLLVSWMWK